MGRGTALDIKAYGEFFPNPVKNIPYHICFAEVITDLAEVAFHSVPQEKVDFTFDINDKVKASAEVAYDFVAGSPMWEGFKCMGTLGFAGQECGGTTGIGIQAADLFAREIMKHAYNQFVGPVRRRTRKSFSALIDTHRYEFRWLSRQHFKGQSQELEELISIKAPEYKEWMKRNRVTTDNIMSRNQFLVDSLRSRKKRRGK